MRILHVFRSPVGGLFRHVRDLAKGQSELGHEIGLMCDSSTGGDNAAELLESIKHYCGAGITTWPIARQPAPSDLRVVAKCMKLARSNKIDIIHGHGSKGGLIARLAGWQTGVPSLYTPHGGSLHYNWASPSGAAFLAAERLLARLGWGFVFVCDFERQAFEKKIGLASKPAVVVHNGLWPEEFKPVALHASSSDLVFVGEVRHLKGIDLLLQAVSELQIERPCSLTVVGDGPDLEISKGLAKSLGIAERVSFAGRLPIRDALARGRIMVVPSRNESFPYVVLETVAAGVPILATRVGGIPEILPATMTCLPNVADIKAHLSVILANPEATLQASRSLARQLETKFSAGQMAKRATDFYSALTR